MYDKADQLVLPASSSGVLSPRPESQVLCHVNHKIDLVSAGL